MRTIFAIFALFAILSFVGATETLAKARLRGLNALEKEIKSESAFLALKDTPFGKNLFSMMSLKFQTSGRLDSINNLLVELDTNIRAQQATEDEEFTQTSTAYQTTITEQGGIITQATQEIEDKGVIVEDKRDTLSQKRTQQADLIAEQTAINDFLTQLAITRQAEVEAHAQRVEDQTAMIAGLEEVIQIFQVEVDTNSELDPAAAQEVADLLNQILASLRASVASDELAESQAAAKYAAFVADQTERLGVIANDLVTIAHEISTLEGEITSLEQDIEAAKVRKANAITLRDDTQVALDTLIANYEANKQVRSDQLSLIQQVRTRLNENPENVQAFLNSA